MKIINLSAVDLALNEIKNISGGGAREHGDITDDIDLQQDDKFDALCVLTFVY